MAVRTLSANVIQHTLTEDDYRTGCRNVSHCQDYVHPDDHAEPTNEMTPGFNLSQF